MGVTETPKSHSDIAIEVVLYCTLVVMGVGILFGFLHAMDSMSSEQKDDLIIMMLLSLNQY